MDLIKKVQQAPASPGIYLMKGAKERVIYVGKAKNLRKRLRSYFQGSGTLDDRKARMVREVRGFECIVTGNELEALILEASFIKRLKPSYNIILRDDKNYPYLKMTVREEWPRLEVVRRVEKDGSLYFGPYVPAGAMWEMLKFIRRTFPFRICRYSMDKPFRPCVQHQMGRCPAPCSESLRSPRHREEYRETVNEVIAFIQGEKKELLESLRNRMQKYSEEMRYEEAAGIRDRLRALEKAWESQRVIAPELGDLDVIGIYREGEEASLFVLFIRNGAVIGQKDFFIKELGGMEDSELLESFINQFYSKELLLPRKIVIPLKTALPAQQKWLSEREGHPVRFVQARGDREREVLKMAGENACYSFSRHKGSDLNETLLRIKDLLDLKKVPRRIGAMDISTIAGAESVGALIMCEDGKFMKDDYRLFRIRAVPGMDDFARIEEVMGRYVENISGKGEELPQLFLIDGGRGQLRAALSALGRLNVDVEVVAIAKARDEVPGRKSAVRSEFERVYLPGRRSPLHLDPFAPSTHLLKRIRDEVHRVAVGYHRKIRAQRTLESPLEKIAGIGRTRRLLLLKHFGSIEAIRKAAIDDIASLKGMNRKVAEKVKEGLARGPKA
ncbi:MAG: excinuclease ABC subunit UvrC [Nitrospiraceae bacterium]|nr:MAG: excinuclease ABC subunit UvrC [Nitrospiraceae bacterium]